MHRSPYTAARCVSRRSRPAPKMARTPLTPWCFQYMEWRHDEEAIRKLERLADLGSDSGWCRLCEKMAQEAGLVP
jgi:hypothetical protein